MRTTGGADDGFSGDRKIGKRTVAGVFHAGGRIPRAASSSEKMMEVSVAHQVSTRRAAVFFALLALGGAGIHAGAQMGNNPTSASNPFFGSVTLAPASDELLKLTLDDAIRRGLETNLGVREAASAQQALQGEKNEAMQQFLPTVTLTGSTGVFE